MLKGVYLTLMVGPVVPVAVPAVVLDALTEISVTIASRGASGFQLSFTLNNRSPLQTLFLLSAGNPIPLLRTLIIVTVNGTPEVLMDGVITNHEITPGSGSEPSTLSVTGSDLSQIMNYQMFSNPRGTPFLAMPPEARVLAILAKYAGFGIVPKVIPSVLLDVPNPTNRIPQQKGTDLEYIQQLAEEVGYVFYIEPGPEPGMSVAYWGPEIPEIKVRNPQPALNINMDAYTNVESLNFRFDGDAKKIPIVLIQDSLTKAAIQIPVPSDIALLNPPLAAIPPIPKEVEYISESAKLSPVRAALMGLAKAAQSADAVSGSGSLDVSRYGRLLKARKLVGVRGAGFAFNGLYYVTSVTHTLKRGEYKQSFNIKRDGLGSTVSRVLA